MRALGNFGIFEAKIENLLLPVFLVLTFDLIFQ
jgi:hypothetical protein